MNGISNYSPSNIGFGAVTQVCGGMKECNNTLRALVKEAQKKGQPVRVFTAFLDKKDSIKDAFVATKKHAPIVEKINLLTSELNKNSIENNPTRIEMLKNFHRLNTEITNQLNKLEKAVKKKIKI